MRTDGHRQCRLPVVLDVPFTVYSTISLQAAPRGSAFAVFVRSLVVDILKLPPTVAWFG